MTPELNTSSGGGWLAAIVGALTAAGAIVVAFRKFRVGWVYDDVHLKLMEAHRAQVEQNGELANKLNRLQMTIVDLHQEVAEITREREELRQEREELKAQLQALMREISRLTSASAVANQTAGGAGS